jgi:hypothetical protein
MGARPHFSSCRDRGAALIIVLAFVVLLTGLVLAYFSRTTGDRQVAQVSFNQTKVDQVAASAMELIIGGLRQEITGPNPTPTPPYLPATPANMLPLRSGNPSDVPDPIPNLVRRSLRADPIPAPGVSSLASAVNSTTDASANGRFITSTRWNSHYLVPKKNTATNDSIPIDAFTNATPDWVILTRSGPVAFAAWDPTLADATSTNSNYCVGRYAYAIYDEDGLLDANVAGYPTNTPTDQAGRKGPVVFADLTTTSTLPYPIPQTQIDKIVGWRNYGSIQPPATGFGPLPNFTFTAALATNYVKNFVVFNTTGFTTVGTNTANGQTDQVFNTRQQLIAFQKATGFSADALQYLGTFLRELNAPTWKPSTPTGSSIDYATLANTPTAGTSTAINRDLLAVRVGVPAGGSFTRADGTTAAVGDLLIKQRFPLSRINGLSATGPNTTTNSTILRGVFQPATTTSDPKYPELPAGGTIQRDFGLQWNSANNRWDYVGATGSTVQSAIKRLDQIVAENREPNFFELLKAGILSSSIGMGSGSSGRTFVNAETKYYSTVAPTSSDYQIIQIGANIIDQWDSDNVPTFINFGDPVIVNEIAGIENLPYLNKLVFKPAWITVSGKAQFAAWLLPSLWNPHQNAPPAPQNVRIAMTSGTMSATLTDSGTPSSLTTTTNVVGSPTQYMTVDASLFGTSPSAPTAVVDKPKPPGNITQSTDVTTPAGGYYGFHFPFATNLAVTSSNSLTAYPDFGAGCNFELQVQVSTSPVVWKAYQRWTGCGPNHPLIFQSPPSWTVTTLQDPEFVTLDPRTLRFGVWGNAGKQSTIAADYTDGTQGTLDWPAPAPGPRFERITALPPAGTRFSSPTSTDLYKYANNTDATVHYTDLDTLQRQGDIISGSTTAMLPTDFVDRPQILNRPFQSLAELGQVFRDEPWKTLDFFMTTASPDAGLLDIFTLHEASMEAGKTSFNTRQKPVLTAILSGATKRLADGTTTISSTQRDSIVDSLVGLQPMVRKTDLLTGLAGNATVTGLGNKEARDLVVRAFSDACQTRTWNLLIDVVAQSGRYPSNASTLAGFLVEGEQHYWVHVAIDRFTGQVIDKQIEVVNE